MQLAGSHLITIAVTAETVGGRAVIDLLPHVGCDAQASGVGKACAQHWIHVINVLKISKRKHSVLWKVLVGLCLHSSNVSALLQKHRCP